MKKTTIIMAGLSMIFLMGCQKITTTPIIPENTGNIQTGIIEEQVTGDTKAEINITSFNDCLNAGFQIMESYPRQCNDGTTTYTEEIKNEITISWSIENSDQTGSIEEQPKEQPQESWTNLSLLQQKLKAMVERRNQESSTSKTSVQTTSSPTTTITSWEKVTEEDIENLENIIDEILKK